MIADLPVGENFQDHSSTGVNVVFDKTEGLEFLELEKAQSAISLLKYFVTGKGRYENFILHSLIMFDAYLIDCHFQLYCKRLYLCIVFQLCASTWN